MLHLLVDIYLSHRVQIGLSVYFSHVASPQLLHNESLVGVVKLANVDRGVGGLGDWWLIQHSILIVGVSILFHYIL